MKNKQKKLIINLILPIIINILFLNASLFSQIHHEKNISREKISVFVSILPQSFFVEKIGGNQVEVHTLLAPGQNPALYSPTPRQMIILSKSHIFFSIGVPFEQSFLPVLKTLSSNLIIINTKKNIHLRFMESHTHNNHLHAQSLKGKDPHIWMNPSLVMIQAKTIFEALRNLKPESESYFHQNLLKFIQELKEMDAEISTLLKPYKGKTFLVFHPSFGYFADAYGLKQKAVELEGKNPSISHMKHLIQFAKAEKIHTLFVQKQFASKAVQAISEELNGQIVILDPLAKNYYTNMKNIAYKIRNAFMPEYTKQ